MTENVCFQQLAELKGIDGNSVNNFYWWKLKIIGEISFLNHLSDSKRQTFFSICHKEQHDEANQMIHYLLVLLHKKFEKEANAWFDETSNQNADYFTLDRSSKTVTDSIENDNDDIFGTFAYTKSETVRALKFDSGTLEDKLEKITD